MINRQKLIEELEWQIAHWQESVDEFHDKEEKGVVKGLKLALEKINSQPQADQWIPCSERLPVDGQNVLCFRILYRVNMQEVYTYHDHYWEDSYGYDHLAEDEGIIAWMPLPKPYKCDDYEKFMTKLP